MCLCLCRYAFVTYKTTDQAASATEKLSQTEMEGHLGKKVRKSPVSLEYGVLVQ